MNTSLQRVWRVTISCVLFSLALTAQPKYRTFTQEQLAQKEERNAGKAIASRVRFVVKNRFDTVKNVLSATVSSPIISLLDSGGFPNLRIANFKKTIVAEGKELQPGDSVVFHAIVKRKVPGSKITGWQMRTKDFSAVQTPNSPGAGVTTITITHGIPSPPIPASVDEQVIAQPTGGNVREYLYQKAVKRPKGIILGVEKAAKPAGWVRSFSTNTKAFPHTGAARCFDSVVMSTKMKPFDGEVKNPSVRMHNNHLLGSLHALKLSILANDAGVTEPFEADATPLGSLLYYDSAHAGNPFNNLTVREICKLTDTALTYCRRFSSEYYTALDQTITSIVEMFSGTIEVNSMRPMKVKGTKTLEEVTFLHANPFANVPQRESEEAVDNIPYENRMLWNYPNPFNPSTVISYQLKVKSVVTLKVFDLLGREVSTLFDHAELDEGEQSVEFDAGNLSSGTYYYRLIATDVSNGSVFTDVKKMTLMR
ncbi:MAG: T9SS type A sorting domain-containing protein [Ignavibacteriae bacterium]|nr:T9SS type A sorting domain-containing protein [Ignavibacteriota bacterium]